MIGLDPVEFRASEDSESSLPIEVFRRVREAAGDEFSTAVACCLKRAIQQKDVNSNDLDRFYS